jgi:phenylalanine-4-hydroxylase
MGSGQLHQLARSYWYTVEFGLMNTAEGLRIYGAGHRLQPRESIFALEDPPPTAWASTWSG